MKKICFLLALQIAACTLLLAQTNRVIRRPEPVNPTKDQQEYLGYTIRLLPPAPLAGTKSGYRFDILKDNKLVLQLLQNPLLNSPKGIQKKEDAYKIAYWMIEEYKKTGHWQNIAPPHITQALKIETNTITQNK